MGRATWVFWVEDKDGDGYLSKRESKLCNACARHVCVCDECVAHDYSADGGGICCLEPPPPGGEERYTGDKDRCLCWRQDHPFEKDELVDLLRRRNQARLD